MNLLRVLRNWCRPGAGRHGPAGIEPRCCARARILGSAGEGGQGPRRRPSVDDWREDRLPGGPHVAGPPDQVGRPPDLL